MPKSGVEILAKHPGWKTKPRGMIKGTKHLAVAEHFQLIVNMENNPTFNDAQELPRILRELADEMSQFSNRGFWRVSDANGNTVGTAVYIGKKHD
jgi:hypothetical protein